MIHKLKKKFILVTMSFVVLILVTVFGILCYSSYHRMQMETSNALQHALMENASDFKVPKFEFGEKKGEKDPGSSHTSFTVFTNLSGDIQEIRAVGIEIDQESLQEIIDKLLKEDKQKGSVSEQHLVYLMKAGSNGYTIAFVDVSTSQNAMWNLIITSFAVGGGALIAFFIMSVLLSNWALKPVETAWNQQKQFVADASHELKTPLTVILADTDIMLSHPQDSIAQQKKWIDSIAQEAQRMKKLVENLLFLAKSDANTQPIQFCRVNLSDVAWSCLLPFESIAYEQGIHLHSEIENDLHVSGDESQLKQLMMIFLDNACKYTPAKGRISVTLKKNGDKIHCTIHNTGSYIDKEDIEHIFERFYRCDKARVHQGGYGLGLSIAKSIIDHHHGQIQVFSTIEDGTSFRITLPSYT